MPRKKEIKDLSKYKINQFIEKLSDRDYDALNAIYDFRCLTYEQIYELVYKYNAKTGEINNETYSKRKLKQFLEMKFITETILYDKDIPPIYQLTTQGINALKKYKNWPSNYYDEHKKILSRGYLVESELNVKERFMAHQYNLNKFVINLEKLFKGENFKYEDEKHLESFVGIRPDGVFTLDNMVFFLEMDMGTENEKQLKEKWDHYRKFLSSNEFILRERQIYVLFIVDGIVRINQRISMIKNTLYSNFVDCFDKEIEIFVNTPGELMDTITDRILNNEDSLLEQKTSLLKSGYLINDNSESLKKIFGVPFSFYARKDSLRTNNFIFEDFTFCPMSSTYKGVYFDNLTRKFREGTHQDIKIVFICDDEVEAFRLYTIFELKDALFTTKGRLLGLKIHKAIFSLTDEGIMYSFDDDTFTKKIEYGIVKL